MESDPLSQLQWQLALTMWMLPYAVMVCFDEDDSVLLEPLIASYLVSILFHGVLQTISNLSHTSPFHCPSAYVVHVHWTCSNIQSILWRQSTYSHKPWLLKPKLLNPDQYQARPKLALWRRFQFLVFDLCPCHQLANFFRLNRLCRLKTNVHVRSLFYAVVCIILNVSVGVFQISELNLMIALTSALVDGIITRLILLSAVKMDYNIMS